MKNQDKFLKQLLHEYRTEAVPTMEFYIDNKFISSTINQLQYMAIRVAVAEGKIKGKCHFVCQGVTLDLDENGNLTHDNYPEGFWNEMSAIIDRLIEAQSNK
jgi:hypothetical protein